MLLSEEQVLTLAPDEPSRKAGKALAGVSKWVSKGASEQALWGECQGSGSKPYQTQIDLTSTAFKCSCPSRKFPCKHGIGLMLLYAREPAIFTDNTPPSWVTEWLDKRTVKETKKQEKEDKPADDIARDKRQQARQQKVEDGIYELLLWMKDIVRNGLLQLPEKGSSYWENMARRMVDAQAPGLAGMIRALSEINFYGEGWQHQFMEQFLRIYLVIQGFSQGENLSPLLQQELRSLVGFTHSQEALRQEAGLKDTWLILNKQITEEDALTTEKYWLFGLHSYQPALVLQFYARGMSRPQLLLTPGMSIEAALVFFPSVIPLRALIKEPVTNNKLQDTYGMTGWQEVVTAETSLAAQMPVRSERPYIVQQLTPVQHDLKWWLKDSNDQIMPVKDSFRNIWKLLALSGGHPLDMAVLGKEQEYEPLGVWHNGVYKLL
ncbi:SWIM zinc finger family protein [Chitinophaga rhizophila]|uniref:SWIM zinc finger family protein n=1 Tax=Chitinophaga rhizophila TaxID=2866212 RepID=A0ABS7GEM2_9BACT|nr:SWIM zinc finger family protein [Chitinophaga rhizophila]MBW8686122.1 SWIM zinc finger family protein [Chitinophaga rhizophila]